MQIKPPIPETSRRAPPTFAVDRTTTDAIMPKIANNIAPQPNPMISLVPLELSAASTPPIIKAKTAPKKPKIPPSNPNTNSVVLFTFIPLFLLVPSVLLINFSLFYTYETIALNKVILCLAGLIIPFVLPIFWKPDLL